MGCGYDVIGMSPGVQKVRHFKKSPGPASMAWWAKQHELQFVTRYYPTKGGWMVFDMRNVFERQLMNGRMIAHGWRRATMVFPNPQAALTAAAHLALEQAELDF